ncbi:MAG: diacylglycerol kinase family protein [Myxococcota bacterium]
MQAEPFTLVVNPRAGAGRGARVRPALEAALRDFGCRFETRVSEGPGHVTELTHAALRDGAAGVAVVGGDGTLNEAVNGCFTERGLPLAPGRWLGPLPAGTGGDFRRAMLAYGDPEETARRMVWAEARPIDVGWARFHDDSGRVVERAFLNIAAFGLAGEVDRLVESKKRLGGRAAFLAGSLEGLANYANRRVRLRVDDAPAREASILNVAVANGRYFGGGMHIAPRARLDDGLFDVVSVERTTRLGQLALTRSLYGEGVLDREGVRFTRGRTVHAEPLDAAPVRVDLDGEPVGRLPASFEIRSGVLALR